MDALSETESAAFIAAWWERWWSEDYSWDGLGRTPWPGWKVAANHRLVPEHAASKTARPAMLQDFWRAEETRLIQDPENPRRRWTAAHAPANWRSGEPAKRSWTQSQIDDIHAAIDRAIARLPASAFTPKPLARARTYASPEKEARAGLLRLNRAWPVPLVGVVVHSFPDSVLRLPIVHATRSAILSPLDLEIPSKILEFNRSLFVGGLTLTARESDVRIRGAIMAGPFALEGNPASRSVSALETRFLDSVSGSGASFSGSVNFNKAVFHDDVEFYNADGPSLRLYATRFSRKADFSETRFLDTFALEAKFSRKADFAGCGINNANFERAHFEGGASFSDAIIRERASFKSSMWEGDATFTRAQFRALNLVGATFEALADFRFVVLQGKGNFKRATFENAARFDGFVWPEAMDSFAGAFEEARFNGFACFDTSDFVAYSAFDGATIKAEIRFNPAELIKDRGFLAAQRLAADDQALTKLERGYRVLRHAAEGVRDKEAEQLYYAYQLRTQRRKSSTKPLQWLLMTVYGAVSKYGLSISRPVACLVGVWFGAALWFLCLALTAQEPASSGMIVEWGAPLHPAILKAGEMSLRGVFNLFGTWTIRPPDSALKPTDFEGGAALSLGMDGRVHTPHLDRRSHSLRDSAVPSRPSCKAALPDQLAFRTLVRRVKRSKRPGRY